ncbi:nuclear transport factor 2 family protein [Nocardioides marmorisolisilvae]|uniref:Nuclear transport factor 2 family protein n=1 Tax=Nocardioides marmorisolisilvae TaxID=1542737 RepID=A0A3N0DV60_9ACTN|nr:nuclear transport factor 2 family protein [Nocardioides marmorisolisilvae]RNL79293.1 nuclear transport factor 2 family protein [Nocardioides marmorisolisilvae]
MDPLARLTALADIANLVARRCRSLDAQDWDGYAACHTSDVVSWAIGSEQGVEEPTRGIEAVVAFLREQLAGATTVHHVHSPEISLTTDATARGTWAMEDRLWWTADGQERWLHGFGHYEETYEKHDGHWLIASRRLVRTRVDRG